MADVNESSLLMEIKNGETRTYITLAMTNRRREARELNHFGNNHNEMKYVYPPSARPPLIGSMTDANFMLMATCKLIQRASHSAS